MTLCLSCARLVGESVTTSPHRDLVRVRVVSRDDGVWETYNCTACGTRAARVIPRTIMPNAQWYVRDAEASLHDTDERARTSH
jgi:hypothetical protein